MYRKTICLVGVLLLLTVAQALAQEQEAAEAPAASASQMACSGFIAGTALSKDLYIFDGADNDFRQSSHQFGTRDFVYLRSRTGAAFTVGNEYSVIRSAKEQMRIKWYDGQGGAVRSLGKPYEDVGRIKVVQVTPQGAIAEVALACGPIYPGDIAVAFQARPIPQYDPTARAARFAQANGKLVGAITAAGGNGGVLGGRRIAHINLGTEDGVSPGQRFRIYHIYQESASDGFRAWPETPREVIGELVVLSTRERSSVAMIIHSRREVSLGDGIELE